MPDDARPRQSTLAQTASRLPWLAGAAGRFVLLVMLPFAVIAVYLLVAASDRYLSETRFTVRDSGSTGEQAGLALGGLLAGIGGGIALQDAYLIRDYINSPDLLGALDEELGVRAAWSDPAIDPVWRLAADASEEDFLEYYRDMVTVTFDSESSIVTVELQGFDRAFTQTMLRSVVARSERLVNAISNQLAREQLDFINGEIDANFGRVKEAQAELLAFQNRHEVVDPKQSAELVTSVIAQMEVSLAEDRAQLKALRSYLGDDATEIRVLLSRIAAKAEQIEAEKTRLTGAGDERLNEIMARFEELRFNVEFAHERYQFALTALESAQVEASRKVKSLVVVSRPNLPEEALYPDRPYILATVGVFLLMGFGILSVILAAIREHME